jgi:hypothetical protein
VITTSSLRYVGPPAQNPDEVVTRLKLNNDLNNATPSRTSVSSEILSVATTGAPVAGSTLGPYATKTYVDNHDQQFELPSYYQQQDLLNVPLDAEGAVNEVTGTPTPLTGSIYGVASLDSTGKIPLAQIPALGSGMMMGPYGPTAVYSGSTTSTPMKIADFNLGQPKNFSNGVFNYLFQLQVYAIIVAQSINNGRPVVEFRINNGTSGATYAGQTLIAQGMGRNFFDDYQPFPVISANTAGQNASFSPLYNIWVSAWLYDHYGEKTTIGLGGIVSAGIWLTRTHI